MWQRNQLQLIARSYNTEKLRLLTYTQALTKPNTTLPYLSHHTQNDETHLVNACSNIYGCNNEKAVTRFNIYKDLTSYTNKAHFSDSHYEYNNNNNNYNNESNGLDEEEVDNALELRRWVRDADELCVAEMRRSTNVNKLNTYVATYKLDHPHWQPLLLPEVHLVPLRRLQEPSEHFDNLLRKESELSLHQSIKENEMSLENVESSVEFFPSTSMEEEEEWELLETSPSYCSSSSSIHSRHDYDVKQNDDHNNVSSASQEELYHVYIDYNKLTTVELMSRHANYALRHIVQKGHAMYFITHAQHSIVAMRGLIESSHVTSAFGVNQECLRTYITHVGPLDVRQVIEIDPVTHKITFNFNKPNITRGVVAVSQVEGYGTWFERRTMLWQRTRRVGAVQGSLGAFNYTLVNPIEVGKLREYEVSLLQPHLQLFKNNGSLIGGGGAEAVCLIASTQVAQNAKMYLGQFEAPAFTVLDAVLQLSHYSALHHKLLHDPPLRLTSHGRRRGKKMEEQSQEEQERQQQQQQQEEKEEEQEKEYYELKKEEQLACVRQRLEAEKLLPVSWLTRSPPPYIPVEVDLPFKLQLSRPTVFPCEQTSQVNTRKDVEEAVRFFPTGTSVGSPYITNVPISLYEFNIHQGASHYLYDESPSSRPLKWWSQRNNIPYHGYMYCMRSELLDDAQAVEQFDNPIATRTSHQSSKSPLTERRRKRKKIRRGKDKINRRERDAHISITSVREETNRIYLQKNNSSSSSNINNICNKNKPLNKKLLCCELWAPSQRELIGYEEPDNKINSNYYDDDDDLYQESNSIIDSEDNTERAPLQDIIKASTRVRRRAHLYKRHINAAESSEETPVAKSEILSQEGKEQIQGEMLQSKKDPCGRMGANKDKSHMYTSKSTKITAATKKTIMKSKTRTLSQLRQALATHTRNTSSPS